MLLTPEHQNLIKMASAKWKNKTIAGSDGEYFVSIIYFREPGSYDGTGGWLEALIYPKDGGFPRNVPLSILKKEYHIL